MSAFLVWICNQRIRISSNILFRVTKTLSTSILGTHTDVALGKVQMQSVLAPIRDSFLHLWGRIFSMRHAEVSFFPKRRQILYHDKARKERCTPDSLVQIFHTVKIKSDFRQGFWLELEFIDHFNTRLMTTLNYSAITIFREIRQRDVVQKVFNVWALIIYSNCKEVPTNPIIKSRTHCY
jgi:hypothetical protein